MTAPATTGYAAAILQDDARLEAEYPDLHDFINSTAELTAARAAAFVDVQQDVINSPHCRVHKIEYLAQIADNTPLGKAEVHKALEILFERKQRMDGDIYNLRYRTQRDKYKKYFSTLNLLWDDSVDVTETNSNSQARVGFVEIVRG
jgi:hypothetical protein